MVNNVGMLSTLKDVAQEAGVSYQTVWRAMHDKSDVSAGTRTHVLEVARRLGYRRNALAGGLRTQRSATLGLVVLDVGNSYTGALARAMQVRASEQAHSLMLMNSGDDVEREQDAVLSLLERRVDGLIINVSQDADHSYLSKVLPSGFPLVAVNRGVPGLRVPTVASRNADVAAAARWLAGRGHHRLGGLFGDFSNPPFLTRYRAYRKEVRRLGLDVVDDWYASGSNTVDFARLSVAELFAPSAVLSASAPTALFAAGNRLTEGALLGLRDVGLKRGEDVEVVGFDVDYGALLEPPMPVMKQAAELLGQRAVDVLLSLVIGVGAPRRVPPFPITMVLPVR